MIFGMFYLLIHAMGNRLTAICFTEEDDVKIQTYHLPAGKNGAKALPVLRHNREYETAQVLLGRLPAATSASAQYSNRVAPGTQHPLCDVLFYRRITCT